MAARSSSFLMFCFLALALGAAGCGEVFTTGPEGGSGGQGAAPEGGGGSGGQGGSSAVGGSSACEPLAQDACSACLVERCEDRYCDCAAEDTCPALLECLAAAGDNEETTTACLQENKDGISLLGSLQVCGGEKCGDDCTFPGVSPCLACQFESCPEATNDCVALPGCGQFFACFQTCVDEGMSEGNCSGMCDAMYPAGADVAQILVECINENCAPECAP